MDLDKKEKIATVFDYLHRLFPNPETELHYSTPFQLVVAVILSAQTTDKQVNKVTDRLFKKVRNPKDILNMGEKAFIDSIKTIGLYKGKGKNIWNLSSIMISKDYMDECKKYSSKVMEKIYKCYGYYVPCDIEILKKLPGIGEKTAKVITHVLYGTRVIAVDTHVHRVTNRLGLVDTKTPEQTSKLLEKIILDQYKDMAHHELVLFGRYYCLARVPKCESCGLKLICRYYKLLKK